jgi:cytochrome bd-type quinol oxidase subunit 2
MATKITMGINFVLGAALTGISLNILEKTRKCTDTTFQRVVEGILIISVALLIAAIAYIICHFTCKCEETESGFARTLFAIYFIAIGVTLIVLGAILHSKSKGHCKEARSGAITTWVMGIVILISSLAFFFFENRAHLSAMVPERKSVRP